MRLAMHRAPALRQPGQAQRPVAAPTQPMKPKKPSGLAKPRGRKQMNKTEAAYAAILEARKRKAEIDGYTWEGMTLRWPDGMTYTPDFAVTEGYKTVEVGGQFPDEKWSRIVLIETKGPWIEDDAKVKFRAARAHWPEFEFKMMQRAKDGSWSQIL